MKGLEKSPTQTKTKKTHTHKNPWTPKLYKKGQPPPRLKNQMTDKKDKKFSILLLLGGDMEQSPI